MSVKYVYFNCYGHRCCLGLQYHCFDVSRSISIAFRNKGLINVYFEAAAVITTLVLLGQMLELKAREQTGGAIRALLNLAPESAHRIGHKGNEEEITLDQVQVGDKLRVRPGEKFL